MSEKVTKSFLLIGNSFLTLLLLFLSGETEATAPIGTSTNLVESLCEIRTAFCGDTAIVIISVGVLILAMLLLSGKLNWVTMLVFVVGAIIFAAAENIAYYLYLSELQNNPNAYRGLEDCACKFNFLGTILGYTQNTSQNAPAGSISTPSLPGTGGSNACDCTNPTNWTTTCCSNYGCDSLNGNTDACMETIYWNSACCDCSNFPASDLCDACYGITPASCLGFSSGYDATCCNCSDMLAYDSTMCSWLDPTEQAYIDCCSPTTINCLDPANWTNPSCNSSCGHLAGNTTACTDASTFTFDCCYCSEYRNGPNGCIGSPTVTQCCVSLMPDTCNDPANWTSPSCQASGCDPATSCTSDSTFAPPCCSCSSASLYNNPYADARCN